MWTRDAGVFLRELAQWGYLEQGVLLAEALMNLVRPNSEGFCTFPEYFKLGQPGSGSELDGTGAIVIGLVLVAAIISFVESSPPGTITITSGPAGSSFHTNAEKYRLILARNHVKLKVVLSRGSLENLQRLNDPSSRVDVGFVQGGATNGINLDKLVSLGSLSYQPLLIFYRGTTTVEVLSGFTGKRLAVGSEGSGTRLLALTLLATNGVEPGGGTTFLDLEPEAAASGLLEGSVDAVFLMGDSASALIMRKLLRSPEIHLVSFSQADAYTRRFRFLNKLVLPKGSIDLGKNLPAQDAFLIGPTVELVARAGLHPALSDLLLEAAREVHSNPSLLQRQGEFPAHSNMTSASATMPSVSTNRARASSIVIFRSGWPVWPAALWWCLSRWWWS